MAKGGVEPPCQTFQHSNNINHQRVPPVLPVPRAHKHASPTSGRRDDRPDQPAPTQTIWITKSNRSSAGSRTPSYLRLQTLRPCPVRGKGCTAVHLPIASTWPQPARCSPCLSCVCAVKPSATLQSPLHPCIMLLQLCKAFSHYCIMPLQLCKAFSHPCIMPLQPCKAFSHYCMKLLQRCKARYAGCLEYHSKPVTQVFGASEYRSKPSRTPAWCP